MNIKDITKIDVIIPGVIGSLIAVAISNVFACISNQISFAVLILPLVIILVTIFFILQNILKRIKFYDSRGKAPKKYQIKNTLKYIASQRLFLTVTGRTNISWFRDISDETKSKELKKLYEKALTRGCHINFIMQHKFVENINASDEEKQAIKDDYDTVIKNFKELKESIKRNKGNIKLFLINEDIENSMTKVYSEDSKKNKESGYFIYDLNMNIDPKPSIIFTRDSVYPEYNKKIERIRNNAMDLNKYEERTEQATHEINILTNDHKESSSQRSNDNTKLMYHYFQKKKQFGYPPVSVQFLITNTCTSSCVMCNHHKISAKNQLSTDEIKSTLRYISDWGTKNVIISGGEPLNHPDCLDILKFSKESNLNLGLLTNGIMHGNKSISKDDARKIKESCKWVQLSIDSFDKDIYKEIRSNDYSIVEKSLHNLKNENVNVEICYTIQRLNVDEAISIAKGERNPLTNGVPIRFKFAHGPNNSNNFLAEKDKIVLFSQVCADNNEKYNGKYLNKMFSKGYFNSKDIAKGTPIKIQNKKFLDQKYKCQIINYSFKIDALGKIYPCCFLFDDNQGENSTIRDKYELYNLRRNGKVVYNPSNSKEILMDILREIDTYKTNDIPINEEACYTT